MVPKIILDIAMRSDSARSEILTRKTRSSDLNHLLSFPTKPIQRSEKWLSYVFSLKNETREISCALCAQLLKKKEREAARKNQQQRIQRR